MIECIPNFSEGRRGEVIDAIAGAIAAVPGATVLDIHADTDHNRSVITFAGEAAPVAEAAFHAVREAARLIDMTQHQGEHPRVGATDVLPFVPLRGATLEQCVTIAQALGRRIGDELGIPVYLYEAAATRPDRRDLPSLRRGEYEGLREAIERDPARAPDFGPARLGPAGATIVGARPPLIAYNIYLNTADVSIARRVARAVRGSSGGLRGVRALGLLVNGRAQVSMNLIDYRATPVHRAFDMVAREAAAYGAAIVESELVGLIPEDALLDTARFALRLHGMRADQVLERRLAQLTTEGFAEGERGRGGDDDSDITQHATRNTQHVSEIDVRSRRKALGITPVYHRIDTCAAEFEAHTPYLYSTYATEDESEVTDKPKVMILGGGPNRIGQGIEFDYCCVHACFALHDLGYETIMVNCNPETVSTDYDIADRLYFEPLTLEDVLNIWDRESGLDKMTQWQDDKMNQPQSEVILSSSHHVTLSGVPVLVQFGGQTPLNLTKGLQAAGVPIWGTSPDAIDLAEDRGRFSELLRGLEIEQPEHGMAADLHAARRVAQRIGYPVLVRPSYVLGGRAMAVAYDDDSLARYIADATAISAGQPVLIDRYLEDAFEVDVDAVGDGERVVIGGIMEHVEEAGVHSGDSAQVMPPYKVSAYHLSIIRDETERIGLALGVRGLMNVQYAIKDEIVYVLEVNPRASRTVPFISKATGVPLARIAAQVAAGVRLDELGLLAEPPLDGFFVKEAVLPFDKFPGAAVVLSPEMRSTGEVMGHAASFGHAFAKAEMGAGQRVPPGGAALLTVNDFDKGAIGRIARDLVHLGFKLYATRGTAAWLTRLGLPVEVVSKVSEGSPSTADLIASGAVSLVISTPLGSRAYSDGQTLRSAAIRHGVMLVTTLTGAAATVSAIRALKAKELRVRSLQEHHSVTR